MSQTMERVWKDMKRNKPSRYDKMIRETTDLSALRRVPYYLQASAPVPKNPTGASYHYPFSIGDEVYEVYAGHVYPLKVTGFHITQHGEYAVVEDNTGEAPESMISIKNIFLSRKQANEQIERMR